MAKIFQNRGGTLTQILNTDDYVNIGNVNQSIAGTKTFSGTVNVPNVAAGDSSTKAANTKFVHDELLKYLTCYEATLEVSTPISSGSSITIPSSLKYIVGSNMLEVSYNGLVEYRDSQYTENGTVGSESTSITIQHNLEAGDSLVFRINGLCDVDTVTDAVHTSGDEAVGGVKSFSSSPTVPNITNTSDSSTKVANTKFVHDLVDGYANCQDEVLDITQAKTSGSNVTLPSGMQYVVGTNQLMVSYNGTVCHVGEQFNEVGSNGSTSTQIQILFDLRVGDKLGFRINGFGNASDIPSVVHRSGSEGIEGVKTFSSSPLVPTPSLGDYSNLVATTKWVKDAAVAPIYLSTTGNDSNNGMTSDKAVRTFSKAIEIAQGLPQAATRLVVSGGSYSGGMELSHNSVIIELLGNVTVTGTIRLLRASTIIVTGQYSLTLTGQLDVDGGGHFYIYSPFSVNTTSTTTSIQITDHSDAYFGETVSVSHTSTSESVIIQNLAYAYFNKKLTINSTNASGYIFMVSRSSACRCADGITITGSNNDKGFCVEDCSQFQPWGDTILNAGVVNGNPMVISGCSVFVLRYGTLTLNSATSGGNSIIVVHNASFFSIYPESTLEIKSNSSNGKSSGLWAIDVRNSQFNNNGNINYTIPNGKSVKYCFVVYGGFIVLDGTINFSSGDVGCTVEATCNGVISIASGATLSGTPSGSRYLADYGGIIYVRGAGANRIPGTTAGSVSSTSYGYYN